MVNFMNNTRRKQPVRKRQRTAVSFSAEDLSALAPLLAVGQAVLKQRPVVVARLKAAMTRMGVKDTGL